MWYIMNDDGYFLFCFDNEYTSTSQKDSYKYHTKERAEKDLYLSGLSSKFKVVYIEEEE